MRKKILSLLTAGLVMCSSVAFAQQVTVTGVGEDRESAKRDAMRNAVEQVVGTYVSSETLVSEAQVVQDEIYAKAHGFVRDIVILNESKSHDGFTVQARVDVNTNPNSELMNRIEMVRNLGDPRICVVVTYYADVDNERREKYPLICEAAMNERLNQLGFSHVLDSSFILDESNIERGFVKDGKNLLPSNNIDYLVLTKMDLHTGNIMLPKYADLTKEGNVEHYATDIVKSDAELDVTVLKSNNGEIISSFRVTGSGMKNSNNNAENISVENAAVAAAEKLKNTLAKKAANVNSNLQLTVVGDTYKDIEKLNTSLKNTAGVRAVNLKSYVGGKAIFDVDTDLKPQTIFRMLREASGLNIFMDRVSNGFIEISIS